MRITNKVMNIVALVTMLTVCFAIPASARSMRIQGSVKELGTNRGIPGALVIWRMLEGTRMVYTDANGNYFLDDHNWCDGKIASASKTGYTTQYKKVYDGSCCSCNPACPPEYGEIACRTLLICNFTLVKRVTASSGVMPLAVNPEASIEADKRAILSIMLGIWLSQFQGGDTYACGYQWLADIADGVDIPGHPIPLPDCPELYTFSDLINDMINAWWDNLYEIRNPEE